jgi:exodeoxyribonuclease X
VSYKEQFLSKCLPLDVETTSEDFNNCEIIEAGFVVKTDDNWEIYQDLYKPEKSNIPPKISALCHITDELVQDKNSFSFSVEMFQSLIDSYKDGYFVAHSHVFDKTVLEHYNIKFPNENWICTWKMASKIFTGDDSIEETTLNYLRFALGLDVPLSLYAHRAGNDAFITAKLLEVLITILEESGEIDKNSEYGPQIIEWINRPLIHKRMPFGKYKNYKIDDLPEDYVKWMIEKMDALNPQHDKFDPDLTLTIEQSIERRGLFQ